MDARCLLIALVGMLSICATGNAQVFMGPRSVAESPNFRVYARSPELANKIARVAEENRKQLAIHWLGREIPNWSKPCPITVHDGRMAANGETKYGLIPTGGVNDFQMMVSGTVERIIDSVLPHEITHTIIASQLTARGKPVPRWADEGACTTVEHISERSKHDQMLVQYLGQGRGIPFRVLFALREYPPDLMPLYAQGYSLSCFLIAQGGPHRFIQFLERGMLEDDWDRAVEEFYDYPLLGKLQTAWNQWVSQGGGVIDSYTAASMGLSTRSIAASGRSSSDVRTASAIAPIAPASRIESSSHVPSPTLAALNKSMSTSSGSYYLDQLQRIQNDRNASSSKNAFVPAARTGDLMGIPYSVGQPPSFQTLGDGTLRR